MKDKQTTMNLKGIISISGMPGLYKVVAQSKSGLIVESLIDKKRVPAYSTYKISSLDDISVFSTTEDIPLKSVMRKIYDKQNGAPAIDSKSPDDELKKYFESVIPEYDKERVHLSDIKKIIGWYNLLQKNDLLKKEEDMTEEEKAKLPLLEDKNKFTHHSAQKNIGNMGKSSSGYVKTQGVRKTGTA